MTVQCTHCAMVTGIGHRKLLCMLATSPDAASADVEKAVISLDYSKIKGIPYHGFEFNNEGNFVLH